MSSTLTILRDLQDVAEREARGEESASTHAQLSNGLVKLQNSILSPPERLVLSRVYVWEQGCLRLAQHYGFLQSLVEKNHAMTAKELSQAACVNELFVVRIMRTLTATGIVDETGPSQYQANELTRYCALKVAIGITKLFVDQLMKVCSILGPQAEAGENNVNPYEYTFGQSMYSFFASNPESGAAFNEFMVARQAEARFKWFDMIPIKEKLISSGPSNPEDILFVDIGGGIGYWTQRLKKEIIPDIPGRIIVQDQAHVVATTANLGGVESMAYNFFTPQPIQGAKFYFLRQILHNWSEEQALQILKNLVGAMKKGYSTLLINEIVLPEKGVGFDAANWDMMMMNAVGGYERTVPQWRELIEAAGLQIVKIWFGDGLNDGSEGVIECILE